MNDTRIDLSDITSQLTWDVPQSGKWLGIGRDAAYAAAARGEIKTLRLGRSLRVPTAWLLEVLGVTPTDSAATPSTDTADAPTEPTEEASHGHATPLHVVGSFRSSH